jgi:hypothetical protein
MRSFGEYLRKKLNTNSWKIPPTFTVLAFNNFGMSSCAIQVLTNRDLLQYISSFMKTIPCKFHCECSRIKWGEFKKGDSVAAAGWLSILIQFQQQINFSIYARTFRSAQVVI